MNKFNNVAQTILQEQRSAWSELQIFLKSKGLETHDLFEVEKYITKIVNDTMASSRSKNPFRG